jgi:hypothetical protein
MIAAVRTLPWTAVWDDHAYGFFVQWAIVEATAWLPLAWAPPLLVAITCLVWWVCAMWLRTSVERVCSGGIAAGLVGLGLCMIPMPEIAYLGLASSAGWPLAAAAIVAVLLDGSRVPRIQRIEVAAIAIVAASHPTGLVIFVLALARRVARIGVSTVNVSRAGAACVGIVVSWWVSRVQDPPLAYLGAWAPQDPWERDVQARLVGAGASIDRSVSVRNPLDVATMFPGSVRFVVTQLLPEPWAAEAILAKSTMTKMLQILVPLGGCALLVLAVRRLDEVRRLETSRCVARGLASGGVVSILVQHVLVGQLTSRQYLFLPLMLGWSAILVVLGEAFDSRSWRVFALMAVPFLWYATVVGQNFRDSFQDNPRQGGTGRYAQADLWGPALEEARAKCRTREADAVVVVSQMDPNSPGVQQMIRSNGLRFAWFDHALVIRCKAIGGTT